ncbi:MAG: GGDEF domain-containing protein [Candidatus Micrarchaeota archaeon]
MSDSASRFNLSLLLTRRRDGFTPSLSRRITSSWKRLSPGKRGALAGASAGLIYTALAGVESKLMGDNPLTGRILPYSAPFIGAYAGRSHWLKMHRAETDPLTNMLRREAFDKWLSRNQKHIRKGTPFTIVFADLDNFKAVNDLVGKEFGDSVLRVLGRAAKFALRPTDVAVRPSDVLPGRWGGDELMWGGRFTPEQARVIVARFERVVQNLHNRNLLSLQVKHDDPKTPPLEQRELEEKISKLIRHPLGLSYVIRTVQPGETLESMKASLSSELETVKVARREQRERAF